MKNFRKTIVLAFTLMVSLVMNAQEYNINFIHDTDTQWKEVVKMAKKQNKPIFVDCYTTWCGPCKKLAKDVFTQKPVADFFNENFISVTMDMEKGEGIKLRKEWDIKAFPTLLYFNKNGEIIHRVVGAADAEKFLEYSKMSLDENKMASNLKKRYDAGERGGAFMYDYLGSLELGFYKELEEKASGDFFNSLPKEDLLKKENWNVINNFMKDPLSEQFQFLVANKKKLAEINGEDVVDTKLFYTINKQIETWSYWRGDTPFETEKEDKLLVFLQESNYDEAPILIGKLLANKFNRLEDKEQYLTTLDYIVKFNLAGSSSTIVAYANQIIDSYISESAWAKALNWLKIAEGKETKIEHKAAILTAKSKVLEKLGNKSEAELAALAAQKVDKEAEAAGKKIHSIPAIKFGGAGSKKKS
jgi:thioredoxin-related protein